MSKNFSIIIPTYNSQKSILAALQSIVNQSCDDFEIVIVDGLSKDDTVSIVKSRKDDRIKVISERDNGIYDAMNKGINRAQGDWLYFLGSDDQLYNDTVLEDVKKIQEKSNINVIYGNVKIVGEASWAKDGAVYDGAFDKKKLLKKNICHQAIFYRRNFIVDKIGYFNPNYKLCADWDFNLRCYAKDNFLYIDKIIANFFSGGESTKSFKDDNFRNDFLKNILSYFKISIFDPLVNDVDFSGYNEVLKLQKSRNYLKYLLSRLHKRISEI
ncbi:MAG TPA: glycosyltransferase family 2 protein [Puia sp.]|nr:glycosyltransferase family 2 protein [Puia sp.]